MLPICLGDSARSTLPLVRLTVRDGGSTKEEWARCVAQRTAGSIETWRSRHNLRASLRGLLSFGGFRRSLLTSHLSLPLVLALVDADPVACASAARSSAQAERRYNSSRFAEFMSSGIVRLPDARQFLSVETGGKPVVCYTATPLNWRNQGALT